MTMQEAVIKNIDTDYSYQLAKRMEQFRSNEKLGYRPADQRVSEPCGQNEGNICLKKYEPVRCYDQ